MPNEPTPSLNAAPVAPVVNTNTPPPTPPSAPPQATPTATPPPQVGLGAVEPNNAPDGLNANVPSVEPTEPAVQIPENYELELPEGFNDEFTRTTLLDTLTPTFKKAGYDNKVASEVVNKLLTSAVKQRDDAVKTQLDALSKMPKREETMALAQSAFNKIFSQEARVGILRRDPLFSSNPEIIKALAEIGAKLKDDTPLNTQQVQDTTPLTPEESIRNKLKQR